MRTTRMTVTLWMASLAMLLGAGMSQAALKEGLVAYYPFDDGTAADASWYHNDGVMDPNGLTASPDGIVGQCMNFTGEGVITVPHAEQISLTSSLTLQVWVKTTSTGRAGLVGKSYAWNQDKFSYYLELLNDYLYPFIDGYEWVGDEDQKYILFGNPIATGAWRHIVVTFDDAQDMMKVYIDGVYLGDGGQFDADLSDDVNTFPLIMGALSSDSGLVRRYIGKMDEVAIWNRALSDGEVATLYNQGVGASVTAGAAAVSPADGAVQVRLDETLQWVPLLDTAGLAYDVYFMNGTDPNLLTTPVLSKTSATGYAPVLDYSGQYLWRVDTYEPNSPTPILYPGKVWRFSTMDPTPQITQQPTRQAGKVGESVSFVVEAYSVSPITYTWYKEGSTAPLGGTDTLAVSIADAADEGDYYCVLENASGTTTSDKAHLTVNRMIARWEFEDNLNDETGAWNGIVRPDSLTAEYDNGISGRAARFSTSSSNKSVVIPGSNSAFPAFMRRDGYSFTCWIKTTQGGWGGLMNMVTREGGDGFSSWSGMGLALAESYFAHQIKGSTELYVGTINNGAWHLVVGAFDPVQGRTYAYVDGIKQDEYFASAPTDVNQELMFGNEMTLEPGTNNILSGVLPLDGLVDDARVYNYALSPTEVAQLYVEHTGPFCVEPIAFDVSGPDGKPDCTVDIYDFAAFASHWLECNMFPTCIDSI